MPHAHAAGLGSEQVSRAELAGCRVSLELTTRGTWHMSEKRCLPAGAARRHSPERLWPCGEMTSVYVIN